MLNEIKAWNSGLVLMQLQVDDMYESEEFIKSLTHAQLKP